MSRIIVKNLPKYITNERFKSHFESHGQITDVKLSKTAEGVFRRFGFIGFKSESDAQAAIDYFNNTYMDTCKLIVEHAKAVHDPKLNRPWSKYSSGSSAFSRTNNPVQDPSDHPIEPQLSSHQQLAKQKSEKLDLELSKKEKMLRYLYADESDEKLNEFLNVMRPRASAKARTWANDDVLDNNNGTTFNSAKNITKNQNKDDDLYQDLPTIGKDNEIEATIDVSNESIDNINDNENYDQRIQESAAFDSSLSDMDYIKSKIKKSQENSVVPVVPDNCSGIHPSRQQQVTAEPPVPVQNSTKKLIKVEAEPAIENISVKEEKPPAQIEKPKESEPNVQKSIEIPPVELIGDTGRLFVRNLPYNVEQQEIESLFSKYGPLSEVHIPIYKDTKLQKGFAFVLFMLPEHAVTAYSELDGSIFQGRILEILPGKEKPKDEEPETPLSFKSKREKEKKAEAGNDFNWNSLFMNSDAVAEAMSKKLNIKKSDILNHQGDNMAVRLALAETTIINETKEFLESHGVSLDAFRGKKSRSNTVILVKNLPASTLDHDILVLFEKFGSLGRVLLPPSKTIALVEFIEPNEAKSAFQRVAYTKFKSIPLFLEWAPLGTFAKEFDESTMSRPKSSNVQDGMELSEKSISVRLPESEDQEDPDAMPVATLFVKNLNFTTTEAVLESCFSVCTGLRSVRIPTKMDKKSNKLSLGYGFLEFESKEDAIRCAKTMQNVELEGHILSLKFSNAAMKSSNKRSLQEESKIIKNKGTKLIIRNIPFEASKREIKSLFSSFGQVKSVRIPTKFDGSHRGFGFVDFLTRQEATSAFESLGATHLYGRHLVLEWAEDEDSVESIRIKTAKAYLKDGGGKKMKMMDEEEDEQLYNPEHDV